MLVDVGTVQRAVQQIIRRRSVLIFHAANLGVLTRDHIAENSFLALFLLDYCRGGYAKKDGKTRALLH